MGRTPQEVTNARALVRHHVPSAGPEDQDILVGIYLSGWVAGRTDLVAGTRDRTAVVCKYLEREWDLRIGQEGG